MTEIKGPPGEFRVQIKHKPRFISEKCVGCGECMPACPVKIKSEFDFGITERTARTYVSNILGKLGLASRTQAALYAVEHKLG